MWIAIAAIGVVAIVATLGYQIEAHWPYRYRVVKPLMEDVLASQIRIGRYHRTYFPSPGFVAEDITMQRKSAPDQPPLGHVDKLVVQGRWRDLVLLQERVRLVDITGLHVVIPAPGSRANHEDFPPGSSSDFTGPETLIENLLIHNSVLDILRTNGGRFSFVFHELNLRNFVRGSSNRFEVNMENPKPRGHIEAMGNFGPLDSKNLGNTRASGKFTFNDVELQDVGDMHGKLNSSGSFSGTLASLEAVATSETPDFAVEVGKPTLVKGNIRCAVNGLTGEVVFHEVRVESGKSVISATGGIQGSPKITNLDIQVSGGRAEDVLRPFIHGEVPITGSVWLKAHAYVAPTGKDLSFLKRLKVQGVFDVPSERLTDREKQKSLSDFSERAQDHGKETQQDDDSQARDTDAISSLKGPASIQDGIASTQKLVFQIPGAEAKLAGTFNFHDEAVHLEGKLKMQSDISHITTGFKSALLKPLAPFMKKKNAGAVVPIAVTGKPGHYSIGLDFAHKDKGGS